MARKGDSVASCLEALFSLTFRHEGGGKVYSSNVVNSKHFLPIHIAAMSPKAPEKTLRILKQDYEHGMDCRTSDGSLPLHLACQYATDPNLLITIIGWDKSSTVNERRNDGFTPLHLVIFLRPLLYTLALTPIKITKGPPTLIYYINTNNLAWNYDLPT